MAYQGDAQYAQGVNAAADLSTKQYYAVKITAANAVNVATVQGERVSGIIDNKPASGEAARVITSGPAKASADAAISAGAWLTTQSDGQVMTAAAGDFVIGQAKEAATAAGQIISIEVNPRGVL